MTEGIRRALPGLLMSLLVAGSVVAAWKDSSEVPADVRPALAQVQEVLRAFALAKDTTDLVRVSEQVGQTLRDSVRIAVTVAEDGRGWAAVGTHLRLGRSIGCAFARGGQTSVETPGGLEHDGSNQILCDQIGVIPTPDR